MTHDPLAPVSIRPIGRVVSDFRDFEAVHDYEALSTIEMRADLAPALAGIEHFSHLHVVYHQHRRAGWMDWAEEEGGADLTVPLSGTPYRKGIFTTRAPGRPSGMGSCIVELASREGCSLRVRGLDALDGSPVLDLKIYIPEYDSFPQAIVPIDWCRPTSPRAASRLLHWDTSNVAVALGMRAGLAGLAALGIRRGEATSAEATGNLFFAQGVEAVTGAGTLDGRLLARSTNAPSGDWTLHVAAGTRSATVRLVDAAFTGADEVLAAPAGAVVRSVEVTA